MSQFTPTLTAQIVLQVQRGLDERVGELVAFCTKHKIHYEPKPLPVPDRSIARVVLTAEKVRLGDVMDYSDADQEAVDQMIAFCKAKHIQYQMLFEIDDGSF